MKLLICLLVALFAVSITADFSDAEYQGLFGKFVERYRKAYEAADFFKRFNLFKENLKWITDHNNDNKQTFKVGVNQFTDMTEDEWKAYKGLRVPANRNTDASKVPAEHQPPADFDKQVAAPSVDWNAQGYVTPVISQGTCGSCYAWASAYV